MREITYVITEKIVKEFRPIQNPKSKFNPIIIFGCSYAAGYVFDNKETISYVMSKFSP